MEGVLGVEVPRVFWKYCTPSILALEYIDGVKIDEVKQIREMGVDTRELGVLLFDAYEKQIFVDGFHHGDPDPNNIYINRRGHIVFLDFGHMGILRPERRELFTRLMFAIFDDDIDDVMKSIEEVSPPIQRREMDLFKDDIYKALLSSDEDNSDVPENRDLEAVIAAIRKHRIELPMQMILTMDTFLSVDFLAKGLNPDFRMELEVKSHIGELFRKRLIDL